MHYLGKNSYPLLNLDIINHIDGIPMIVLGINLKIVITVYWKKKNIFYVEGPCRI